MFGSKERKMHRVIEKAARVTLLKVARGEREWVAGGDIPLPELDTVGETWGHRGLAFAALNWVDYVVGVLDELELAPPEDKPGFVFAYQSITGQEVMLADPSVVPPPQLWAMQVISAGRNHDGEMVGSLLTAGWPSDEDEIFSDYLMALLEACGKMIASLPVEICEPGCNGKHRGHR